MHRIAIYSQKILHLLPKLIEVITSTDCCVIVLALPQTVLPPSLARTDHITINANSIRGIKQGTSGPSPQELLFASFNAMSWQSAVISAISHVISRQSAAILAISPFISAHQSNHGDQPATFAQNRQSAKWHSVNWQSTEKPGNQPQPQQSADEVPSPGPGRIINITYAINVGGSFLLLHAPIHQIVTGLSPSALQRKIQRSPFHPCFILFI